jgi:predicted nucleic acid-binding protein
MGTIDKSTPLVVCDAGPLIHLDELDSLDLLSDFAEVLVPDAVWREVVLHRPAAMANPTVMFNRITPLLPEPPELEALALVLSLHTGEWEALRVAIEHRPGILLTDDTAARLAAGNLGVTTHGTIGILVRAIRRRQRSKAEILTALQSLPTRSTLHLKRSLLEAVIQQVERNT